MSLPSNLNLNTDKNLVNYEGLVLRQSEQGLTMTATLLNEDKSPYDLSGGKIITFTEHKDNDKFVTDTNVQLVDATHGLIKYQLHKQVYAAQGRAWFEISDSNGDLVDSTQEFYINVLDAANASIYNSNYISKLEDLLNQMQTMVDKADGQLKAELQKIADDLAQKLIDIQSQYDKAETTRNSDFSDKTTTAISSMQSEWSDKEKVLDGELSAIKSKLDGFQSSIDSVNASVSDMNTKADSVQTKVDSLKADIGNIDFSSYATKADTYTKSEVNTAIENGGKVKTATINGGSFISPDEQGNLSLTVPNPDLSKCATVDSVSALKDIVNTKPDVYLATDDADATAHEKTNPDDIIFVPES